MQFSFPRLALSECPRKNIALFNRKCALSCKFEFWQFHDIEHAGFGSLFKMMNIEPRFTLNDSLQFREFFFCCLFFHRADQMLRFGQNVLSFPVDNFECRMILVGGDGHFDKISVRVGFAVKNAKEWGVGLQGTTNLRQLRPMGRLEIDEIGLAPVVAVIFEQRHGTDYSKIRWSRQTVNGVPTKTGGRKHPRSCALCRLTIY
jgi:hypothetical protein